MRCHKYLWKRCSLHITQFVRNGDGQSLVGEHLLAVTGPRQNTKDAFASLPFRHIFADLVHVTDKFQPGNVLRHTRRGRIEPTPLEKIGPVDSGSRHFHSDILTSSHQIISLFNHQVGELPAQVLNHDALHEWPSLMRLITQDLDTNILVCSPHAYKRHDGRLSRGT